MDFRINSICKPLEHFYMSLLNVLVILLWFISTFDGSHRVGFEYICFNFSSAKVYLS